MIQNVIRDMGGIAAFGVISVCLFFAVFTGALLFALAQRKSFCERMCALPLDDGSLERSADLQSAPATVGQVCNLPGVRSSTPVENFTRVRISAPGWLQVGDTGGWKAAPPTPATRRHTKGVSHE